MPPFPIPSGFLQVVFNWHSDNFASGKGATIFGMQRPDSDLDDVGDFLHDQWASNLQEIQSGRIILATIKMIGDDDFHETVVNEFGGSGEAMPSYNTTALVKLTSNLRGHGNQGRNYWPGFVTEESVDEAGTVAGDVYNDINTGMIGFFDFTGQEVSPVILHRNGDDPTVVTGVLLDRKVGSQRRRIR